MEMLKLILMLICKFFHILIVISVSSLCPVCLILVFFVVFALQHVELLGVIFLHLLDSVLEAAQFVLLFLEKLVSFTYVLFGSVVIFTYVFMLFFQFCIFDIFELFLIVQSYLNDFFIFLAKVD